MTTRQKLTAFCGAAAFGSALALGLNAPDAGAQESMKGRGARTAKDGGAGGGGDKAVAKIVRSDREWRRLLNTTQYNVLRQKGTEQAFTGALWNNHRKGTYVCAGCGLSLFTSDTKFESGTGWPSFWQPIKKNHVEEHADDSHGMRRVEVVCARCDGHLGHVFDDGPRPTGLRYCMNSAALRFVPNAKAAAAAKPAARNGGKAGARE